MKAENTNALTDNYCTMALFMILDKSNEIFNDYFN